MKIYLKFRSRIVLFRCIAMWICVLMFFTYTPFNLVVSAEGEGDYLASEEMTMLMEVSDEYFDLNSLGDGIKSTFQYWDAGTSAWKDIPDGVPADGLFRQLIEFDIYTSKLVAHNGRLCYRIPTQLKGVVSSGQLYNGEELIGTIEVFEDYLLLQYNMDVIDISKSNFHGSAKFNERLKTENLPEDGNLIINHGNMNITLHLEQDAFYKHAGLIVKKNKPVLGFNQEKGYYYLDYTITLTAENTMTKAVVTDYFTEGTNYIHSYVDLTDQEKVANVQQAGNEKNTVYRGVLKTNYTVSPLPSTEEPGVLVWSAYNLKKGEIRTLSYRVRLTEEFSKQVNPSSLKNNADAYSASDLSNHQTIYLQDSDTNLFQPKAEVQLTKTNSTVYTDENGQDYAEHTVTISAPSDNSYAINNIVIHDWLAAASKGKLVYDWSSFTLDGVPCTAVQGSESNSNCAEVTLDKLTPGQVMQLKYRVWIKPEAYLNSSGPGKFTNSVQTTVDGVWLNNKKDATISPVGKQWQRKSVDNKPTNSEQTITMGDTVLDKGGIASTAKEFTVPSNSYKYQIIVNEDGGWDVSSATFQDAFGANMAYVGYVMIEAVDVSKVEIPISSDLSSALQTMKYCPVVKTIWLKVDGESSFSFRPVDLGFLSDTSAYRLTYYAKQINNTTMTARNDFKLSGTVGKGGNGYSLSLGSTYAEVQIVGNKQCALNKEAWYYTTPDENNNFYNDKITQYWVVRASGDLEKGLQIKDSPISGTTAANDCLVGIYVGSSSTTFNAYSFSVEELSNINELERLGLTALIVGDDYTNDGGTVTLLRNLVLEPGQQLFVVYRTRFNYEISNYKPTDYFTSKNKAMYRYDGDTNWSSSNEAIQAIQIISNSKGASKTSGGVYSYNGSQWKEINSGELVSMPTPEGIKPGIYTSWLVNLNLVGSMKGKATVVDTLPEGVSFAYVSLQSIGNWLDENEPISAQPEEVFLSGLSCTSSQMENEGVYMSKNINLGKVLADEQVYYDSDRRTVIWSVDKLRYEGTACLNYFVTFRVVCRVDDMDFRSDQLNSFTNTAKVYSNLGIQELNNTIEFSVSTLKKSGNREVAVSSGTYPFTIQVNPQGIDLLPNSDMLTLVDEMNSALSLRPETLVITNTNTGQVLDSNMYTVTISSEGGKTLVEFTLPDSTPITIKYNARVTAAPETKISISNVAYWKGYSSQIGSQVIEQNFQYEVSGTGSTYHTNATLKITKKSATNLFGPALSGAKYIIYPITLDNNDLPVKGEALMGDVLEKNGVYTYNSLNYNTIYCVLEVTAPQGYLLDENPHYIAIADSRDTILYKDLLDNISRLESKGIAVDGCFSSDTMEIMLTDDLDTRYNLIIHKVDGDTGEPLEGVGFTIYEEASSDVSGAILLDTTDGQKYCTPVGEEQLTQLNTSGDAVVRFSELVGNGKHTYYLAETRGLTGYLTMNLAIPVQVTTTEDSGGNIRVNALVKGIEKQVSDHQLEVTLTNYAKLDMPSSGGLISGNIFKNIGGVLIIIAFGMLLLISKKQIIDK